MIVRMSKIEIAGPKALFLAVLSSIRHRGVLHIETNLKEVRRVSGEPHLKSLLHDRETLSLALFYEDLKDKVDRVLNGLPNASSREVYLTPFTVIDSISKLVDRHDENCRALFRRKEALQTELRQLDRYASFLIETEPLLGGMKQGSDLDFVALELRDPSVLEDLRVVIEGLTRGRFHMQTVLRKRGTFLGLIAVQKEMARPLKNVLLDRELPQFTLPSYLEDLPFPEKVMAAQNRQKEVTAELKAVDREIHGFSQRWAPIYGKARACLADWLSLHKTSALLYETDMCFLIFGWMPSTELTRLERTLTDEFGGQVVVQEKEILEQDLDRVPVILKNPPYFRPFEIFARLLPLPQYTSFDPTPFLGIFFPIFFGMILGDIGYGVVLVFSALWVIAFFKERRKVKDAGKILLVSSIYTIFFGWLFGECFGHAGGRLLGLEPVCFDRQTSVMTMLYFALSVGVVHVAIGLFLGFLSAVKKRLKREALFKLLSILLMFGLAVYAASFFMPVPWLLRTPLLMALLVLAPSVLLIGGLLAPLELFKTLGNVVSYARIMAVGLTSVLLAYIANHLAGNAGSILVGILVGILLHALNILLGVFAPTIQSLRLHYVEFFGKFLESGGREFEPLEKTE